MSSLAVVGLLFLSVGCSRTPAAAPTVSGFRCHAAITYDDFAAEGVLTRTAAGTLTLDLIAPEALNGVSLLWNGENVEIRLHGLSFAVDAEELPACGVGNLLLGALDAAVGTPTGVATADGVQTQGTFPSGEFTLLSDPVTGHLLSLSVPSCALTVRFSSFEKSS